MKHVKSPILYVTHKVTNKVKGTLEKRRRNAIAFVRLFLITINKLAYKNNGVLKVRFGDILELIEKQSQFTLIAIATFPLVLPIPYPPGMPTILAIPVLIFIINGLFGKKFIKIPDKILNYSITIESLKKIVTQSRFVISVLARISKGGRIPFLADEQMAKLHIFFMFCMCFLIVMPFPGTNYLPAVSIFVIALGVILTDGILVTIGYLIGVTGIFVVMLFMIFGTKIVLTFIHFIKYLLY